jgi:ABC-type multidrug transport system fused ATPase/permease subunit
VKKRLLSFRFAKPRTKQRVKGVSALDAVAPFRLRIGFTYALNVIEDLLELSYPWATGLAIDGLIAHDMRAAIWIVLAWTARGLIGGARKMYDTRVYNDVYSAIVVETVSRQRAAGAPVSSVAARSAMAREFVMFFERDIPVLFTAVVGILGSAAMLFWYDLWIASFACALFLPVYLINRVYSARSLTLNQGLNGQLETEVGVIERAEPAEVAAHYKALRRYRVKLSDAEAFNWTSVELLSIFAFVAILWRATGLSTTETGDIYAILSYVWRLMENLDHVPQLVQQVSRLIDIRKRIEAGDTIESIGAELEKAEDEDEKKKDAPA